MAILLLENGPDRGKGLELKPGESCTLGRDPSCQLVIEGELISRQHCRVKEFKGAFYVKDLDSLNGVFINDQRVTQAELKPGDKLQLGDAVLTFLQEETIAQAKEEKILGGYRLLERIGRGGMGTVYRAIQISLDREVALKLLSPELVKDRNFVEQFFREARAAGQLNHPHIVQVYDVGQEGDTFFYSMEYVRGGSLEDRLRAEGKLEPPEALRIALEASMALEYAESRHIVHRDIKPDNLMLSEDGRVRVADLGLALSLKSGADQKGQPILGTPHFISPEQALRREIDIRSDIYSLGATLYRCLTGRTVFTGASAEEIVKKAVREEPQPLRELAPAVPEKVAQLVHRMLRKDPNERFASAKELREAIERLTRHPARTRALIAAVAVAVLAIGVAVVIALQKPETVIERVESGDVAAERKRAFDAKSEADKRKLELEALRSYLVLLEQPPEQTALRGRLAKWIEDYGVFNFAEGKQIEARIQAIDDAVQREEAARLAGDQVRRDRIEAARAQVSQPLTRGELMTALTQAVALAPRPDDDPATIAALNAEKLTLVDAAHRRLVDEQRKRTAEVEAAIAAGPLDEAAALCAAALELFVAPPADLPEPFRSEFAAARAWFERKHESLVRTVVENAQAVAQLDAERLSRAFGADLRSQVANLDLAAAATVMEQVLAEVETESARTTIAPVARVLRQGDRLLTRTLTALDQAPLATEPAVKLANMERAGSLADYDAEKRSVTLKHSVRGGTTSSSVALSEFANSDGLRQLIAGRMTLTADEQFDLGELMVLVDVLQWVEAVAPLYVQVTRYDRGEGWSEDRRRGLPMPEVKPLASDVAAATKELPTTHAEAAERLHRRADAEEQAERELLAALEPFYKPDSSLGWLASSHALNALLEQRADTLLVRILKPWLVGP